MNPTAPTGGIRFRAQPLPAAIMGNFGSQEDQDSTRHSGKRLHPEQHGPFCRIPNELTRNILSFASPKDLGKAECVCSTWLTLLRADKTLQKRKLEGRWPWAGITAMCPLPLTQWGTQGKDAGKFDYLNGIVVDRGRILVADTGNHRGQVFKHDGTLLTEWGSQGTGDGQFNSPAGIAADYTGRILVLDGRNLRVHVFQEDGTFITKWSISNRAFFKRVPVPMDEVKVHGGIAVDDQGRVFVTELGNRERKPPSESVHHERDLAYPVGAPGNG